MFQIKVTLCKARYGWEFSAVVVGTMFQATGKTKDEAVGALVVKYGHNFGLTVITD